MLVISDSPTFLLKTSKNELLKIEEIIDFIWF